MKTLATIRAAMARFLGLFRPGLKEPDFSVMTIRKGDVVVFRMSANTLKDLLVRDPDHNILQHIQHVLHSRGAEALFLTDDFRIDTLRERAALNGLEDAVEMARESMPDDAKI